MNFDETLEFLYTKLPMFSRLGANAFKKDLTNIIEFCEALDNPQDKFKSIHIAGTNGKGSVSNMLASVLQEAGYKVGLYTSPHLKSFTERIRLNGAQVSQDWVVAFVQKNYEFIIEVKPSFFEITVAMAFTFFAEKEVDFAVIETGLGGRLDSTNVITPILSIITNIGYDHMDMLGNTLEKIAGEKAGIIKENVPVIVSETQEETEAVFFNRAHEMNAPIIFADRIYSDARINSNTKLVNKSNGDMLNLKLDLLGDYQVKNAKAVVLATGLLNRQESVISKEQMLTGLSRVKENTGLRGRFEIVSRNPLTIFDVAHNKEGILLSLNELKKLDFDKLHIIYGCVNDKDVTSVLPLFPKEANYYFTQANVPRAMNVHNLMVKASDVGISGKAIKDPENALAQAQKNASNKDCILVIGSFFILESLL